MISRNKRKYLEREYRAIQLAISIRRSASHLTEERITSCVAIHRKLWDKKGGERHLGYTTASKADKKEYVAFSNYLQQLGEISLTDTPVKRFRIKSLRDWTPTDHTKFKEFCELASTIGKTTTQGNTDGNYN